MIIILLWILGLKKAKDAAKDAIDKTGLGKYVPTSMDFTSKPTSQGDNPDGNSSSTGMRNF